MRSLMCLLAIALIIPVACGGPRQQQEETGGQLHTQEGTTIEIPAWVTAVPVGDGAFYGIGSAAFQNVTQLQHATDSAAHAARDQLAATIQATIRSVSQRYSEQVLTAEGEVVEEGLSRIVSEQVVDELPLAGATIDMRSEPIYDDGSGLHVVFVRVAMDLDNVAEATYNEMAKRVDSVRERADDAFADLRRMTGEEAEELEPQGAQPADDNVPDLAKSAAETN